MSEGMSEGMSNAPALEPAGSLRPAARQQSGFDVHQVGA